MKWALACPLALLACGAAEAVHVPMMGVPQQLSFHYLTSERVSRESAPATLLTATEASVLASVNPSTGQISWRQQLEGLQGFDALGERVCTWQEHKLACFEAATGYLIWDYALPSTEKAQGVKVIQDAVQAWTDSHFHLFSLSGQLLQSSEAVGVQGTLSSNNKAVLQDPASTRLSLLDVSDPTNSPSELSPGQDDYLILDHGIVTLKKGSMQPFCPDPSNPKKLHGKALKSSFTYTSIQRMSGQHLLGLHSEGQAEVVQLTDDCQLEVLNNFKDAAPDAQYSPSIDRNGELHVARLAYSPNLHLGLVTIYSSVKSDWGDKGYIQGSTLPLNEKKHGPLLSFVTEVAPPDKSSGKPQTISRSVWVSSSGQVASCFGGAQSPAWVREEGLAALSSEVQPVWLDVSKERLSHAIPSSESIVGQAIRYLELMREYTFSLFPQLWRYIFHVPVIHADNGLDPLTAQFGFKKLAIVPSQKGSVFALDLMTRGPPLDLGNTHIVWNTHLDTAGAGIQWKQMVLDDNKVLLLGIKAGQETWAWELDAQSGSVLNHRKLSDETVVATMTVPAVNGSAGVASVNSLHQLEAFPSQPQTALYYVTKGSTSVQGWHASNAGNDARWTFALPPDSEETVYSIISQQTGAIASLGRNMGNRSTLYKYLNPHLFLLITASQQASSASLYLIDAVSGTTVWYTQHVGDVDVAAGIQATLTENWLVYSFRDPQTVGKSSRIVSVELYEDWVPRKWDPKRKTKKKPKFQGGKHLSSFDAREYPIFESRSFIAPFSIKSMGTSSTRLGVTTKSLLVTTDTNALVSIPRPRLDPRRPLGKPSKSEIEERLIAYDPVIPLEPKWIVSEDVTVMSSSQPVISSASTLLESTSLVLLAGLDLFSSRIAPSGTFDLLREDFNKTQLLLTIAGLAVGVAIAKPLADRKRLRSKWYTQ